MSTSYVPATFVANPTPLQLTEELEKIRVALDETLNRLGGTPNQMETDLDMNGNDILNAGNLSTGTGNVDLSQIEADIAALQAGLAATDAAAATSDANIAGNISALQSDLNQVNFLLDARLDILEAATPGTFTDYEEKSASFNGVLPDNTTVASYIATRAGVFRAADTHPAAALVGTGDGANLAVYVNGTLVANIAYGLGTTTGTITFLSDTVVAVGDTIRIDTVDQNGLSDVYLTLRLELT